MTEKEKMCAHVLYDANFDPDLAEERANCKILCLKYNTELPYDDFDARNELLGRILGGMGNGVHIEPPFWCDYGRYIHIGDNFYANHGLVILDAGGVEFGDYVFIGPNCGFHTSGHPLDAERRNAGLEYAWPITVGNNVWFGAAVQVMPGVTIGDNSVIGAGSVVTKDIPAFSLAVGNPCRVIRELSQKDFERNWSYKKRL